MKNATSTISGSKSQPAASARGSRAESPARKQRIKPAPVSHPKPSLLSTHLTTAIEIAKVRLLCTMWRHFWHAQGDFKRKTWTKQKLEPLEAAFNQTDPWLVEPIALQRRNRDALVKGSCDFAYQHILSLESACENAEQNRQVSTVPEQRHRRG